MAISEMRRLSVIGHRSLKGRVLQVLQELGLAQVASLRDSVSPEEWAEIFGDGAVPLDVARTERRAESGHDELLAEVKHSIEMVDRFDKVKKSLLDQLAGTKTPLSREEYESYVNNADAGRQLYRQIWEIEERLAELASEETTLKALAGALAPWDELTVRLSEVADTKNVKFLLGTLESRSVDALSAELEQQVPDAVLSVVGGGNQVGLLLAYHRNAEAETGAVIRKYGFSPVGFAGLAGTPSEEAAEVRRQLDLVERERARAIEEIRGLAGMRTRLYALYDHFGFVREKDEAAAMVGETESAFMLEGWVRRADLPKIERALAAVSDELVVANRPPHDDEDYPVVLENRPIWDPFEAVTKIAGLPKAGTIDPTPYLGPFFFVFFGITLGDAGYGIMLALLSYWLIRRLKPVGTGRQLITLLGVGGVSAFIVGTFTGSWFGDLTGVKPLWFDPTKEPLKMLALSLALGVVHLFWGLGVKFMDNVRRGKIMDALYDQVSWWLLLSGLILWLGGGALKAASLVPAGKVLAAVGALGIVLFQGRSSKNIFARLGSGLYALYGVSGYMSDVLSYSRLLALGLSGSVVAVVFNLLAKMTLKVPIVGVLFMAAILVAGHVFNLALNIISAFVHSSRLQYVEFYGKFYEGGGKRFAPLGVNTKYTQVNRTEEA